MAQFITGAVTKSQWPSSEREYVLTGRSNVGKSTFINHLATHKIAYVGKTPGKTRMLNFYQLDGFFLVDAPGYGYAKRTLKELQQYQKMMEEYFSQRQQLKGALLLLDIRRIPNEDDQMMLEYFRDRNIPYRIVITKTDKQSNNQNAKALHIIAETLQEDKNAFWVSDIRKRENFSQMRQCLKDDLLF